MQQFLQDVFARAKAVHLNNGVPTPTEKVEKGDTVFGVLPDDLKRLYVVYDTHRDELARQCEATHDLIEEAKKKRKSEVKPEDMAIIQQHMLEHNKHELLGTIFWDSVKMVFPELVTTTQSIAIREGWQIVTYRDNPLHELMVLGPFRL